MGAPAVTLELLMAICAILSTLGTGAVVVFNLGKMNEKLSSLEKALAEHTNTRERLSALEAVVFNHHGKESA